MIPAAQRANIVTAQKLGQQVYELILDNWGNNGTGQDADNRSLIYPALATDDALPTISGIAISPRSDIDRCVLTYAVNPLKPLVTAEGFLTRNSPVLLNDQIISVDRPWYGEMDAGRLLISGNPAGAPPFSLDTLFVHCVPQQEFSDSYSPSDSSVATQWGTTLAEARPGVFVPPVLRLLLFLNGAPPQPTRRAAMSYMTQYDPDELVPGPTAKALAKVVNVHGRRHIRVYAESNVLGVGATGIVTIGGVRGGIVRDGDLVTLPLVTSHECELNAAQTLDQGERFCVDFEVPQIDYLTIYFERTGVGSQQGATFIVDAVD